MLRPEQRTLMARYVVDILGAKKARIWWTTPNPMFGDVSPTWLREHNEEKLYKFIVEAYESNRASLAVSEEQAK